MQKSLKWEVGGGSARSPNVDCKNVEERRGNRAARTFMKVTRLKFRTFPPAFQTKTFKILEIYLKDSFATVVTVVTWKLYEKKFL